MWLFNCPAKQLQSCRAKQLKRDRAAPEGEEAWKVKERRRRESRIRRAASDDAKQ